MAEQLERYKKQLTDAVYASLDFELDTTDAEMYALIDEKLDVYCSSYGISLDMRRRLRKDVFSAIRELDVLQPLLDDPRVTEIMVNGPDEIFVERAGRLFRHTEVFESAQKLSDVVQQIVAGCNRVVNEASPIVDARLKNGARVNVVLAPVALNGPILTIRRFPEHPITMKGLIAFGALTEELFQFLSVLVKAGCNIFISGGTGSGKTTFLNALSDSVPGDERVITIEDNAELQIRHIPNLVRMEARNANVEGCREITIRDLIKSSLRMRPDRIIVGEVRGSEAIDMIQAMNTGHDGSMSTGHANSTKDMLSRLETMVLMGMELPLQAVRRQIASAIDVIVHLSRMRDKSRKLVEICEVTGQIDPVTGEVETRPLFVFRETGQDESGNILGIWEKQHAFQNMEKIKSAGLSLPAFAG